MTFREQNKRVGLVGLLTFGVSMLIWVAVRLLDVEPNSIEYRVLETSFLIVVGIATTCLFFIVGRSVHRDLWLNQFRQSTLNFYGKTASEVFFEGKQSRFWRWWMHVDMTGEDLDRL